MFLQDQDLLISRFQPFKSMPTLENIRGCHGLYLVEVAWEAHFTILCVNTCIKKTSTFAKLNHQNGSKFYNFFFMSRYKWYLLHSIKL